MERIIQNFQTICDMEAKQTMLVRGSPKWTEKVNAVLKQPTKVIGTVSKIPDFVDLYETVMKYRYYQNGAVLDETFMHKTLRKRIGKVSEMTAHMQRKEQLTCIGGSC